MLGVMSPAAEGNGAVLRSPGPLPAQWAEGCELDRGRQDHQAVRDQNDPGN